MRVRDLAAMSTNASAGAELGKVIEVRYAFLSVSQHKSNLSSED